MFSKIKLLILSYLEIKKRKMGKNNEKKEKNGEKYLPLQKLF